MTKLAYSPHQISRSQLRPLGNSVIVSDMVFDQRFTNSGIIIPNDNGKSTGIRPRWGQVYAVGPEQKDVAVGQWICVAHGRWTRGIEIQDEAGTHTVRKVDPKDIMMVSDTPVYDESWSDAIHVEAKPSWMQHT